MQFGQAVGPAGEDDLAEGGQFQDLRQDGRRAGAGADEGGSGVGVDVREDAGEMGGVPVVGVAVQQDEVGAETRGGPDEVGEQDGVGAVDAQTRFAEPGVQLEGQARGGRDPQQVP
jgi:hypothetical protein